MAAQLLIDRFGFKQTMLLEDKRAEGGRMVARGEFARADYPTENKRIYPRALWERELKRLEKTIVERKLYGELDHPGDGRTQLKRCCCLITDLHLEGDVVVGQAEILKTAEGNNLRAIFDAAGQVGVSSRGFGTTRPRHDGMDVVQDDYRLMTFDFVAEPANTTSYPTIHSEDKASSGEPIQTEEATISTENSPEGTAEAEEMSEAKTVDDLRKMYPALCESLSQEAERDYEKRAADIWAKKIMGAREEATTDLRSSFAEQLQTTLNAMRQEIQEQARTQLLADPEVAGAKTALESIKQILRPYVIPEDVESVVKTKEQVIEALQKKLAEQETRLTKLQEENDKLAAIAKEAGYRYHLESMLHGVEKAELIRKLVGDVKQYESVESLNAKVTEVVEEINKVADKQVERDSEIEKLHQENRRLTEATEKAMEATRQLMIQNYIEQRLARHPRAEELRTVMESMDLNSKDQVDRVLDKFREKRQDPAAIEEARARVRRLVGSAPTREYMNEAVDPDGAAANARRPSTAGRDFNGLGQDLNSLRALSGIGED